MRDMRIFVTGEQGNLARAIAAELATHAHIRVVDPEFPTRVVSGHHRWPELDVTDRRSLVAAIQASQADVVVHSAAIVNTDKCAGSPQRCVDSNVLGTLNVLEACAESGARLMYFSTTATYDPQAPRPFTEYTRQRPPTLYGITKYAGEMLVTGQSVVPHVVVRPCFVYGDPPYDHSSQLCRIATHQALRGMTGKHGGTPRVTLDPAALKDYMRVEDFATAVVALLELNQFDGTAYNVSAMSERPMREYFSTLESFLGLGQLDMEWDAAADYMRDHVVDSSRLRKATGWRPTWVMEAGVSKLAMNAEAYARANMRTAVGELLYA